MVISRAKCCIVVMENLHPFVKLHKNSNQNPFWKFQNLRVEVDVLIEESGADWVLSFMTYGIFEGDESLKKF